MDICPVTFLKLSDVGQEYAITDWRTIGTSYIWPVPLPDNNSYKTKGSMMYHHDIIIAKVPFSSGLILWTPKACKAGHGLV